MHPYSSSSQPETVKLPSKYRKIIYDLVTKAEKRDPRKGTSQGRLFALLNTNEIEDEKNLSRCIKAAKKIIPAIKSIHEILINTPLESLSLEDRKLLEKLIKQLKVPNSQTFRIAEKAMQVILLESKKSKNISAFETISEIIQLNSAYLTRLNQQQLYAVPELGEMDQIFLYFAASEDPNIPMHQRIISGPRTLSAETAGHSFVACTFTGKEVAIIKSSTQGMCAKHNPKTLFDETGSPDTYMLNVYGQISGQDVLGEALTFALARILGFRLVPPTCLLRISHHFLGAPNPILKKIRGISKFDLSEQQCQQFLVEQSNTPTCSTSSPTAENEVASLDDFKRKLEMHIVTKISSLIHDDVFEHCDIHISPMFRNIIQSILLECQSADEFRNRILSFLLAHLHIELEPDFPLSNLNTLSGLTTLLSEHAKKDEHLFSQYLAALIGTTNNDMMILAMLIAKIPDIANTVVSTKEMFGVLKRGRENADALLKSVLQPPYQSSHLCSVQQWVLNSKGLNSLTKEERAQISPHSYGMLALIDGMTVQQDRNMGNIVTLKVTMQDIETKLEQQIEDLPTFIHSQFKESLENSPPIHNKPAYTKFFHKLGNAIVEAQLPKMENWPIEDKLTLESDVHQLIYLLAHNQDSLRTCFAIDNAISFINPLLPGFNKNLPSNNAWILKTASQLALTPSILAHHLTSIDIINDLLPKLDARVNDFHRIATGKEMEGMPWTPPQKSLFVLSCRIIQMGIKLDKTAFEMGLMKDQVNLMDAAGTPLVKTPIMKLFHKFFMKNNKLLPLHKVNLEALDTAIIAAYGDINTITGTFEDGFAAWNQIPDLPRLKKMVDVYQQQEDSSQSSG